MEIYKEFKLEAAHRLTGVAADHPCRALHGHSYTVRVCVAGPVEPVSGMVIDFSELKQQVAPALGELDHHFLNDIPGLENPTSENLVRWLWRRIKPGVPGLVRIILQETPTCGVSYEGED